MPLETATYITDLNAANPAHSDQLNLDDSHARLIKSTIKATFPNFTSAPLNSTQAALDYAALFVAGTSGVSAAPVGSAAAPSYSFVGDLNTGIYHSAADEISVSIGGTQTFKWTTTGIDALTYKINMSAAANLTVAGVAVFPLQSANIGAAQVLTAAIAPANITTALIAPANITYSTIQNVTNGKILGNFSGGAAAPSEYGLGTGLSQSGGNIVAALQNPPLYHIREQQAQNTASSNVPTSGAWRTVVLNTDVTNEIAGASRSVNTLTLPAGTFFAEAEYVVAGQATAQKYQLRLQDTTSPATLISGLVNVANGSYGGSQTQIMLSGARFTLAGIKSVELQVQTNVSASAAGAANFGPEVYVSLRIWKIA